MRTLFRIALLLFVCLIGGSQAHETLIGAGPSLSQMHIPGDTSCSGCESYSLDEKSVKPAASLEVRGETFGGMLSYGAATRDSHAVVAQGMNSHTWTSDPSQPRKDIRQTIDASWIGLQGTARYQIGQLSLRAQAGAALVFGSNWERGTYNDDPVEHKNTTREVRPLVGLGADYAMSDKWLVKVEWQRMTGAVKSYWTESNNINAVSLQIARRF